MKRLVIVAACLLWAGNVFGAVEVDVDENDAIDLEFGGLNADVSASSDGDVLEYDETLGGYKPVAPVVVSAGTGIDITDGVISSTITDTNTTYTAGTGLTLTGTEFSNDVTDTDTLADLSCSENQIAKWNGSAWACAADADTNTTYTASTGLTLTGTAFSVANDAITPALIDDWYEYDYLPVEWWQDAASAPGAASVSNDWHSIRSFPGDSTTALRGVWRVPHDITAADLIQFRVVYVITEATGPASEEGVVWGLSGLSMGDSDPASGTPGTEVVITDVLGTGYVEDDLVISEWSGDVTITGLTAGELASLVIRRVHDNAGDTYVQPVGMSWVDIRYVKNPAK